jgi:hypothetical protein
MKDGAVRVDSETTRPQATPTASPPAPHAAPVSTSRPVAASMRNDRVDRTQTSPANGSGRVADLRNWMQSEWSTVAGAAHGLASVPGVVSKSWQDAAKSNEDLAKTIDSTLSHWQEQTASQRQGLIDGLSAAATPISTTASSVARDLSQANRAPLAVERAVAGVIGTVSADAQAPLRKIAAGVGRAMSTLPAPVENRARAGAQALTAAASAQSAKASTTVGAVSELVGRTVGKAHGLLTGNTEGSTVLDRVPLLRDLPVAGAVLTGAAVVADTRSGKSLADATVANVGATLVGTAAGNAVTAGLASFVDSAAIADETAAALGAAAAAGPLGWTVAAGVVTAAAVGYGVYKAVESKPGQDVVDGVAHLSGAKIEQGLSEARSESINAAAHAWHSVSSSLHGVHE